MQQQEYCSLKSNLSTFAVGLGRLLCYWWLAELMVHLMYMHAIYSSDSLLRAVSCWTLGNWRFLSVQPASGGSFSLRRDWGTQGAVALSKHSPLNFFPFIFSNLVPPVAEVMPG